MFFTVILSLFLIFLGILRLQNYKNFNEFSRKEKCEDINEIKYCRLYGVGILSMGIALAVYCICSYLYFESEIIYNTLLTIFCVGLITSVFAQVSYKLGFIGALISKIISGKDIKKIKYFTFLIMLINVLTIIFFSILDSASDMKFYFLGIDDSLLMHLSFMCFAICLVIISVILQQSRKNKGILLISVILSFCIIVCSSFGWAFTSVDNKYYKFYSPDRKYSFIVYEWSFLLGGGVHIYERINPFFINELGRLGTADGYRAIENNAYETKWNENKFTLTISCGNGAEDSETFELKLR